MGTATATYSAKRSAWSTNRDAAVVGGGPGIWILCAKSAVWDHLRWTGRGDRVDDLDGALHGDYFPRRGLERGTRRKPQKRASNGMNYLCAWNAIPDTKATSVP